MMESRSVAALPGTTPATGMDVPRRRARPARYRRAALAGLAVIAVVAVTIGLSRLRAAAPGVDRDTLWLDTVERGEMVREVQGAGTLVPEHIRWISAVTPARIERIAVEPGAPVTADTVLVELGNPEVELAALEAERQVASASAALANLLATQRNQRLAQESLVSTVNAELGQARRQVSADDALAGHGLLSDLEMQRSRGTARELETRLGFEKRRLTALEDGMAAQLPAQKVELDRLRSIAEFRRRQVAALTVRAGADGILQELPLEVGQWVAPGALLAKVAEPDRLQAEIRIPEGQARDVQVGQPAAVDTHSGIVKGTVTRVDPAVVAGSVRVAIKLDDPLPRGARPDLSVQGTIELERLDSVLHVGRPALGQSEGSVRLFKLTPEGDHAEPVTAVLGRSSVKTVEIRGGLNEGDRVILSDMSRWDSAERIRLQ